MGSPPSVSSEERAPLNSESVDYVGFLQLYATAQNPNVKYWYDVKSILVRRRKKAKNAESTSSSKDDGQPDKTKKKREVRHEFQEWKPVGLDQTH
mmetsp:Transcript_11465/g.25566  ORF Transcript_11465/g.25566 Transcript_11465/m.25566 type:complete len:95 (+) Transcript_11465:188-472(+)